MPDETCVSCKHFLGGGDYNLPINKTTSGLHLYIVYRDETYAVRN